MQWNNPQNRQTSLKDSSFAGGGVFVHSPHLQDQSPDSIGLIPNLGPLHGDLTQRDQPKLTVDTDRRLFDRPHFTGAKVDPACPSLRPEENDFKETQFSITTGAARRIEFAPQLENSSSDMHQQTDEELYADYKATSNEAAFNEIHNRYRSPLLRYIRTQVPDDNGAWEDILQLVLVRLMTRKDTFENGRLFRPWLFTLTDRLCADWRKTKGRRERRVKAYAAHIYNEPKVEAAQARNLVEEAVDENAETPEEAVDRIEQTHKALVLYGRLPAEYRLAVRLMTLDGVTSRKAAEIVGRTNVFVWNRNKMALDMLQKQMATESVAGEKAPNIYAESIEDLVNKTKVAA